jgi:dethiobiotin synthetase
LALGPHTPRILISAPASDAGKTTVTAALIGALRRRGLVVQPFKIGLTPTGQARDLNSPTDGRPSLSSTVRAVRTTLRQ